MITEIPNINELVNNILHNKTKVIGYGCFAYGVYEYWYVLNQLINTLLNYTSKINIFIDEYPNNINKLNNIINSQNASIKLSKKYDYNNGPLQQYVDLKYDNVEFLNFINILNQYNINNKEIKIYGINNDSNKIDKEMAKEIKNIYENNRNLSIIIGHSTNVQKVKLNRYKSMGYYLDKIFGKSYVAITTAAMKGEIKFTGDRVNNIPLFARPLPLQYKDRGSLQRYVKNNINIETNIIILKISNEMGYSFYFSGELREPYTMSHNYNMVDNFDYVIYIVNSTIVNDIYV